MSMSAQAMLESLDTAPSFAVAEPEYRRLLGYPPDHVPSVRARELAAWARRWYAEHGRPWIYLREVPLEVSVDSVRLDDIAIASRQLRTHLVETRAQRAVLAVVSAGAACERHARELWREQKPDEYYFLEIFGSAVVEHLVASLSGRICTLAGSEGFAAVPHYSPGYAGWDVAEQVQLFDLIRHGQSREWPEKLEVLSSGMLRPKKSLLAVVGLAPSHLVARPRAGATPCENCSYHPCRYRRAPYRHASFAREVAPDHALFEPASPNPMGSPLTPNASYSVNPRALAKWARERVQLTPQADGKIAARFRFDGTTCSNMGRPLTFEYHLVLGPAQEAFPIVSAECRPAPGDSGHTQMCAYLNDPDGLMQAIAEEKPLLGRPLDAVLTWQRAARPSGCYCDRDSRAHKWGLALEAIHFALVQSRSPGGDTKATSVSTSP